MHCPGKGSVPNERRRSKQHEYRTDEDEDLCDAFQRHGHPQSRKSIVVPTSPPHRGTSERWSVQRHTSRNAHAEGRRTDPRRVEAGKAPLRCRISGRRPCGRSSRQGIDRAPCYATTIERRLGRGALKSSTAVCRESALQTPRLLREENHFAVVPAIRDQRVGSGGLLQGEGWPHDRLDFFRFDPPAKLLQSPTRIITSA